MVDFIKNILKTSKIVFLIYLYYKQNMEHNFTGFNY